jgi:hypothetical protein
MRERAVAYVATLQAGPLEGDFSVVVESRSGPA